MRPRLARTIWLLAGTVILFASGLALALRAARDRAGERAVLRDELERFFGEVEVPVLPWR